MTLSQIIAHALRQLDEDAEDVSEYEESFKVYANMGYDIAVREYLKPRRTFCVDVDEKGNAPVPGMLATRVVELRDEYGYDVPEERREFDKRRRIWVNSSEHGQKLRELFADCLDELREVQ